MMKGLILAGGHGTRIRPITHTGPKQLIPIANKPVLYYIIEDLVESGVRDIGVIVGYTEDRIRTIKNSLGDGSRWDCKITYIEQDAPRGLAHAVWIAQDFLKTDDFIVYLGDNILNENLTNFIEEFKISGADVSLLISEHSNPGRFGVVEINGDEVVGMEEKPKSPKSNFVITGVYIFKKSIFDFIKILKPSDRGELELTHAIQKIAESKNHKVIHHIVSNWWDDAGTSDDILHANHMMLSKMKNDVKGKIEDGAVIIGNVSIGKFSLIKKDVKIRGPAIIGDNCVIENSYIGPYTSIGDNTKMTSGEIESSIVMSDCIINIGNSKIVDSLIGKNCILGKSDILPKGVRLVIGEDSRIKI
jgi:glucose-1-phosphate thymidylyltransferase